LPLDFFSVLVSIGRVAATSLRTTRKKMQSGRDSILVKVAMACVFLAAAIIWQQYYFRAIDNVDGNGTTLWNWPAFVLIVFGIGALIVRLLRFARKHARKSK
jgi:hypothetical protein